MKLTDFDADEVVRQIHREVGMPLIDKLLGAVGLAMAACATFLPWYVYLHPEKFSMPSLWQGTMRDLPEGQERSVVSVSPLAMTDMDEETAATVDRLTTATVPGLERDPPGKPRHRRPRSTVPRSRELQTHACRQWARLDRG